MPAQIIEYAARLLPAIAPGLAAPTSVRRAAGCAADHVHDAGALADAVLAACRQRLNDEGSIGVIAADADIAGLYERLRGRRPRRRAARARTRTRWSPAGVVCVPASLAKGLEFDAVIVVEPSRIVAAEPRGLRRLYVVLTRAVSALHIVHAEPLPSALQSA